MNLYNLGHVQQLKEGTDYHKANVRESEKESLQVILLSSKLCSFIPAPNYRIALAIKKIDQNFISSFFDTHQFGNSVQIDHCKL